MKLFVTNIIAKSLLGFSNKDLISVMFLSLSSSASLSVSPDNEKKATSAPDINAELVISPNRMSTFNQTKQGVADKRLTNNAGSVSK